MLSFLEKLRRARNLRAILVIAALFASQSPLACAFEALVDTGSSSQSVDLTGASAESDCCALCTDCHLGCGTAVTPRTHAMGLPFDIHPPSGIQPDNVAAKTWTPPTPLRPPIQTA